MKRYGEGIPGMPSFQCNQIIEIMKTIPVVLILSCGLFSCKPTIFNAHNYPDYFCNCSSARVDYQLKDAESSSVRFDPASAVASQTTEIGAGGQTIVRFSICQDAVAIISAVNRNGTVTQTLQFRRATEPTSISGRLNPLCIGSRFDGWSYVPLYDADRPSPIPHDGVLSNIVIEVDRVGNFSYNGVTAVVRPGRNLLSEFQNMRTSLGEFVFTAPLNINEQCAETGSVLPSGRIPPPGFPITLEVMCP